MKTKCILLLIAWICVLSIHAMPSISKQPAPALSSVSIGGTVFNRVTASATAPPIKYQWRFNGSDLPGSTNVTLTLTNIAAAKAGIYTVVVSDMEGFVESSPWTVDVDLTFTKITTGPLVAGSCSAAAWADYDNDGFQDLYQTVSGGPNVLCKNNHDGTFTKVSNSPVVSASGQTFGVAWADFDNNGYLDLLRGVYNGNDQVFRNEGEGLFTMLKVPALPVSGNGANTPVWGDYDNDGFIDFFVCNGFGSTKNAFFHNNGNGSFTAITTGPMIPSGGNTLSASWADYDNDGLLDIVVTRNGPKSLLFHNLGHGEFASITNIISTDDPKGGGFGGPSWGDYDNDGYLDLVVTGVGAHSALYHNDHNGNFSKVENTPISIPVASSPGACWADYDNDGYLDLFVGNHHGATSFLYHNNGDGNFTRVTTGSLVNDPGEAQGGAWADINNDGFPDLFVPNIRNNVKNFFYLNNGNSNAWLTVHCQGRLSNRAAIGAKIKVLATINGKRMWQLRAVSGGGSLGNQDDLRCGFGLGNATNVETVRVEWPSGIVQEVHQVAPRQILQLREPSKVSIIKDPVTGELRLDLKGGQGIKYDIETSPDLEHWMDEASIPNENGAFTTSPHLFYRAVER